ncbi:MAG TPA: ABC transporter permease [Candidatus Pullichristensenella stercoripullorum]|nr:ABC transporter permease [Candidatus Pullichristensenella stercoripullorum]
MSNSANTAKTARKPRRLFAGYGVVFMVLIAVFVIMSIVNRNFMTYSNIYNLARSTAVYGIVALAMTFVIVTGGIDLSVGTHVGLAGMVVTLLTVYGGWNIFLAIFVALLSCAVAGIINGVLIHDGKLPPFIATMGMMTIVRAVILLISDARNISGLDKAFTDFAKSTVGFPGVDQFGNPTTVGIPVMALVWVILIVISWLMFRYTTFGRNVFACGSNVDAARLSGISVRKTTYGVYLLSGVYCGIGGILLTSRMASGIPTLGDGYEMDAIAASVIGGASMSGGEGYIGGTVVGSILIATIDNVGTLFGLNSNYTDIIIGALIVASVLIDRFKRR